MGRIPYLLFAMLIHFVSLAQDFSEAEYFIDTDPGAGNGTPISLSLTASPLIFTASIPTTSLTPGFHHLGIRLKESGGPWGIFESRGFYITTTTIDVPNITAAEYFIDSDPGKGNGTSIPVTPGANVNFIVNVPATSLLPGFHFLAIRTKGADGKWGVFESRGFYITTTTTDVANIVAAEYFFDNDPGDGNGTSIPVTPGATANFTVSLPSTGLPSGFHFLAIRVKDAAGKWGTFEGRGFYVSGSTTDVPNIAAAEYFFDNDPGVGNGLPISITPGATSNFTASLPVAGLSQGFHFLAIRTQGADGKWGIFESRGFYISSPSITSDIVAAEYFIDTEPGIGNGQPLTVNPIAPNINQTFTILVPTLPAGDHFLFIRAMDTEGFWSEIASDTFTILSCTPPAPPVTSDNSRCGVGSVTLTASGASGSQVYRWYEDATTSVVFATGASFNTPSLSASKTYFVSIFDPTTTCESSRAASTATVSIITTPSLNVSGSITFCEGNSIFLTAPSGFANYLWSDGRTTPQIIATTSGDYFVQVGDNNGCFSANSDTLSVTAIPAPAKPVIQVTGNTTLCGIETALLSGPAGFQYVWSTGATTQDIIVSQGGNYSLSVRDANGCQSATSDPVTITTVTGEAFITQDGNLLIASAGGSYQWFLNGEEMPGETGQVLEINLYEYGVYAVEVTTGNCFSRSDDFIYVITAEEKNGESVFSVAPNPIKDILIIHNQLQQPVSIVLVDAVGKRVFEKSVPRGDHEYNVGFLSTGIYFLVAETPLQSKVIKLHKL